MENRDGTVYPEPPLRYLADQRAPKLTMDSLDSRSTNLNSLAKDIQPPILRHTRLGDRSVYQDSASLFMGDG